MIGRTTLLINPPLVNGVAFTRQGRCQERDEVLGTTKPPYSLVVIASLFRQLGIDFRVIDQTAERLVDRVGHRAARRRVVQAEADRLLQHDADARLRRRARW